MKIAICDDCRNDLKSLRETLISNDYIKENAKIYLFDSGNAFIKSVEHTEYDVVFLDVDIPDTNGIELGLKVSSIYPNILIVYVTNYSQYAIDAFDCHAFHYLLKSSDKAKTERVINNLIQNYKEKNKYHIIKIKTETKRLPIKDIYYIEYCRRHVIYHLKDKDYETVGKFGDIYEELKEFGFYQIHQGYIVNMDKIVDFDKFSVILQDDKTVMMSTRKRTEVIQAYTNYIEVHK